MKIVEGDRTIHLSTRPADKRKTVGNAFDWLHRDSKKLKKVVESRSVLAESYGGVYLKARPSPF